MSLPLKKRKTVSCNFCRRRKIKCDKGKPCNRCIQFKATCEYSIPTKPSPSLKKESPSPSDPLDLSSSLFQLNEKITRLESSIRLRDSIEDDGESDDEASFFTMHDCHYQRTPAANKFCSAPTIWGSIKFDPILKEAFDSATEAQQTGKRSDSLFGRDQRIIFDANTFNYLNDNDPISEVAGLQAYKDGVWQESKNISKEALYNLMDNPDVLEKILNQVISILPKHKIIWIILHHYFTELYSIFPFLNESHFIAHMERILGGRKYVLKPVTQLHISSNIDFAHLGILLIILRLVMVTIYQEGFFTGGEDEEISQELNCDHNTAKNWQVYQLAQIFLNQFDLFGKSNFTILQFLMFIRIWRIESPEVSEEIDDDEVQMINTVMLQIGLSLGLHQDSHTSNRSEDNLRKKFWYLICLHDHSSMLTSGHPSNVGKSFFNTSVPVASDDIRDANALDLEVDKHSIRMFVHMKRSFQSLNKLYVIHASDEKVNVGSSFQVVESCFANLKNTIKLFQWYLHESNDIVAMRMYHSYTVKFYISTGYVLISMCNMLYGHYLTINKPAKGITYLIRIFNVIGKSVLPLIDRAFLNPESKGKMLRFVFFPRLLVTVQRVSLIIASTLIKLRIIDLETTDLEILLMKLGSFFRDINRLLSSSCYASWKFTKIYEHLTSKVNLDRIKQRVNCTGNFGFTTNCIRILVSSLTKAINEFEINQTFYSASIPSDYPFISTDGYAASDRFDQKVEAGDDGDSLWLLMLSMKEHKEDFSLDDFYKDVISTLG